jgi:hypothetical protein
MSVGIIFFANLFQWFLKQVADANSLADVEIPRGIKVDASRLPQIFMWAGIELLPGVDSNAASKLFGRSATIHDCTL